MNKYKVTLQHRVSTSLKRTVTISAKNVWVAEIQAEAGNRGYEAINSVRVPVGTKEQTLRTMLGN